MLLKAHWWKVLGALLVLYTLIGGFLLPVPELPILQHSIRNLYFHVPMWFGMILLFAISMVYSIRYLSRMSIREDWVAVEYANSGTLFGILGLATGMLWAQYTWGSWWSNDAKQIGAVVALLIYLAYFVLRGSLKEEHLRAKVSAVYNIFAFFALVPLLFILPRMTDSLHPGAGGNPGFNTYDLDSQMRTIFYPAILGWLLLGVWLTTLRIRVKKLMNTDY